MPLTCSATWFTPHSVDWLVPIHSPTLHHGLLSQDILSQNGGWSLRVSQPVARCPYAATASHERFLIKASLKTLRRNAPVLTVDGRRIPGLQTDPEGRFWQFDVPNLRPGTAYTLRLEEAGGCAICDPWPLRTFPTPGDTPERLEDPRLHPGAGPADCGPVPGDVQGLPTAAEGGEFYR
jgi:hypothetical protein